MTVKEVGSWIRDSKRTPRPAPSARVALPPTLKPPDVPLAGSRVTIRLPSAPTFRLLTSTWPDWRASSVPLDTSMSNWPSPLTSLPVTTAPPLMDRRSAPVPKEMSPSTVPLRMSRTSAPEPRRMSPRMAGSFASGTPSPSASGSL
ncbi:hypothetical protein D3C77_386810 [compost metagenome]